MYCVDWEISSVKAAASGTVYVHDCLPVLFHCGQCCVRRSIDLLSVSYPVWQRSERCLMEPLMNNESIHW